MKKLLIPLLFFFMLFSIPLNSSNNQQHIFNHQTFGLYQNIGFGITGGVKKYDSYSMNFQTNTGYRYRYEVYVCSRTINTYNQYRNTNVYGLQIFVNNENITIAQYPYGLNFTATINGTLVYIWESNSPLPTFGIKWQNLQ